MIDPIIFAIAMFALSLGSIGVSIFIVIYTIVKLIDLLTWFIEKKRERISQETKKLISGSVGAKFKNGEITEIDCGLFNEEEEEYQMIQIIYDPENDEIVEARGIRTKNIDSKIEKAQEKAHRDGKILVYKNFE